MKNKLIIIFASIIFLLLGVSFFLFSQMREYKSDSIRWQDNYEAVQEDASSVKLKLAEFKKALTDSESQIDSLLKESNIKPKQVDRIVYVTNTYVKTDTVEVKVIDNNDSTFYFHEDIDCISIAGLISVFDGVPELIITNLNTYNEVGYVVYQKRQEWKFLGIKSRIFGRKKTELEVKSKCGESEVREIEIIKE